MLHFQQAFAAKAIRVLLRDIMLFVFSKSNTVTLAFGNIPYFAFEIGIATWAGFRFVLRHTTKIPIVAYLSAPAWMDI